MRLHLFLKSVASNFYICFTFDLAKCENDLHTFHRGSEYCVGIIRFGFDLARVLKNTCFPVEIQLVNDVTDIPGQLSSKR
jgi:hypothetical protein